LTVINIGNDAMYIRAEEMRAGIALARYSLEIIQSINDEAITPEAVTDAFKLIKWAAMKGHHHLYASQLQRFAPNAIRKAERFMPAIGVLVSKGYLSSVDGGMNLDGSHRAEVWEINRYLQM